MMHKKSLILLYKDDISHKRTNSLGFTLMEILISIIILATTIMGLANIFVAGKRYIIRTRTRMIGGELGKFFLDPLQQQVRQDQWGNNCVSNQANCCSNPLDCQAGTAEGLDRPYTAEYTVTPDTPITNINRVRVDISWYVEP